MIQAQKYLEEGCEWVVDIDLEKFFDRVNHDKLMARVARRVKDKEILRLIRRYLQSGIMEDGLVKPTGEGTPQGGPLSPLLSNIMLDDLDKELEKRQLRFVRYADDCNIYVKSERAAIRVMESLTGYLTEKLKLKINKQKSAIDNPWNRQFLGFTFTREKGSKRIIVDKGRIKRLKAKIKGLTKKMRGKCIKDTIRDMIIPIIRGWTNYYGKSGVGNTYRKLDGWIRRRIRCIIWRQWKRPRTRYKRLINLGVENQTAGNSAFSRKGPWRMAATPAMHRAISNNIIVKLGYIPMEKMAARLRLS